MENEGLERIKVLASEIKDDDLNEIVKYLLTRTDMNEKYLNEEKSLSQMVEFINNQAMEMLKQKKKTSFVGMYFKNETVFSWAIHYWDEPNEKLNLTSKKVDKKEINKVIKDIKDKKYKIVEKSEEKSNEKDQVKKENKISTKKKKWQAEGQLTLFDFMKDFM